MSFVMFEYRRASTMEPMLRYAELPRWRFPFAQRDLGTYLLAIGQVYGGGEQRKDDQMPVEESSDLMLLPAQTHSGSSCVGREWRLTFPKLSP
jgi:hypothetical protein